PSVRSRHHACQGAVTLRLGDKDFDIVTFRGQAQVERSKVTIIADTKKAHRNPAKVCKISWTNRTMDCPQNKGHATIAAFEPSSRQMHVVD
ncbi:hypothetical protein, partial [Bradyrhizobium sp.]|uniref:hypothetical protein n=1 Tax=Bradyrhizobium sp. TaxID=376 RepID=UPI003BB00BA0